MSLEAFVKQVVWMEDCNDAFSMLPYLVELLKGCPPQKCGEVKEVVRLLSRDIQQLAFNDTFNEMTEGMFTPEEVEAIEHEESVSW